MDKAGKWLRVSTTGQDEQNQGPDLEAYVAGRGYTATRTYELRGKSASKGEQEAALSQAVRDIEQGHVTVIVAWALDRLDRRGIAESFRTKLRIEEAGGRVEFTQEPSMSDLEFAFKAYMANEESKRKAERSRIGLDAARANGAATGTPPWAYSVEGPKRNKRFVLDPEKGQLAARIYAAVADGMTCEAAARHFATEDKKWNTVTICKLIRNPVYRGTVLDTEGRIVHRCEGAVDAALWARANKALSSRSRKLQGRSAKAMLTKVATCGECGSGMYRTAPSAANMYYRCTRSHGVNIHARLCEDAVSAAVLRLFGDRELTITKKVDGHNYEIEIQACKDELRALDPDAEDYDDQHAALRAELARLKALPAVPDTWQEIGTGVTFADKWNSLDDQANRGEFLRSSGIKVHLRKAGPGAVALSFDWGRVAAAAPVDVIDGDDRVWTVYRNGGQVSETPVDWNSIMALTS